MPFILILIFIPHFDTWCINCHIYHSTSPTPSRSHRGIFPSSQVPRGQVFDKVSRQQQMISKTCHRFRWSLSHWLRINGWLVVYLPLWKIWVRQLGWWHSQYMEKQMFQTTKRKLILIHSILIWTIMNYLSHWHTKTHWVIGNCRESIMSHSMK